MDEKSRRNRSMRILGYVFTIIIQTANLVYLEVSKDSSHANDDPQIKLFQKLLFRYFTCWNVFMQILNSVVGLINDCPITDIEKNNSGMSKKLSLYGHFMFASIVWPCSMMVSTLFWSLYLYDRSLIFPEFIDGVISPLSNHILHTLIIPIAIWDLVFRERKRPRSHHRYIRVMISFMVIYTSVFYYTYLTEGRWLYPVFDVTYDSGYISFFILHLSILIMLFIFYFIQWNLTDIVNGKVNKKVM